MKKGLCVLLSLLLTIFCGCGENKPIEKDEILPEAIDALRSEGQFDAPPFSYVEKYDPLTLSDDRIHAIEFDSVNVFGKPSKVFAYLGIPEKASRLNKVPAVVLVHGGGGTAFPEWVQKWVNAGYAAIAYDTEGNCNPTGGSAYAGTFGSDPENRYTSPSNDGLSKSFRAIKDQWMYHAVSAAIKAHSLLAADPRVDASKIGITGISWGGFITSIAMGVDERINFAIPVYISGNLREGIASFGGKFFDEKTIQIWEPALFFERVKAKVLIVNSDHDGFCSMNQSSKCQTQLKTSALCIVPDLIHGHVQGWNVEEIISFANACVGLDSEKLIKITSQPTAQMGRNVEVGFELPQDVKLQCVKVYAINGAYAYRSAAAYQAFTIVEDFHLVDLSFTIINGKVNLTIPNDVSNYYINLVSEEGYTSTTSFVNL